MQALFPPTALVLLAALLLAGCATRQNPDPIESLNRKTFAFNEVLDKAVLKPVATAYKAVVPQPVRKGVGNVFSNLADPWSGVTLILQGEFRQGLSDFARFGTNTTVGLLGVMDVATDWGMPRHGNGFSDTLNGWGFDSGAYIVLPLLGPSTTRGTAALPVDTLANLTRQIDDVGVRNSLFALRLINGRAQALDATQLIDEAALDKYLFVRDAYLQRLAQRDDARRPRAPAPAAPAEGAPAP